MNNTISGVRPEDSWLRRHEEDEAVLPAPPVAPWPTPLAERAVPEPAASPPTCAVAPPAPTPLPNVRDVRTQRGMDAFRMSLTGWYHTPSGDVAVATPFLMSPGYREQKAFLANPQNRAAMQDVARRAGLSNVALARVQSGRGTPDEIHKLTQALIDEQPAGKVRCPSDVQKLMFDHAIGMDCAGYVQQAYLHATGRTRAEAGLDTITNESLSGLSRRGYEPIGEIACVRPGDLIVFGPRPGESGDPGHRAIVYDQRLATADDMRTLLADSKGQAFAIGGPIRVIEMDSSYGSGGNYDRGGVQRQTWLHNEATGQWAQEVLDGDSVRFAITPTLYAHPLEGFYRRKGD
jgi:hypothetical protein